MSVQAKDRCQTDGVGGTGTGKEMAPDLLTVLKNLARDVETNPGPANGNINRQSQKCTAFFSAPRYFQHFISRLQMHVQLLWLKDIGIGGAGGAVAPLLYIGTRISTGTHHFCPLIIHFFEHYP